MIQGKGKILSLSGRQDNVFSGKQVDLVQEENLVVFHTDLPRVTEKQRGKKWETQAHLVPSLPRETVNGAGVIKRKRPLLYRMRQNRPT